MRVLGVDPGTNIAGYGIVEKEGEHLRAVGYGAIRTRRGDSYPQRLKNIYDGLSEVIEKFRPDCLAIEEVFAHKSVTSAIKIGEGRAVALLCAAQWDLPVFEYASTSVKKSTVGAGKADKSQVQKMVKMLLNLSEEPYPVDASDALAIAICHCNRS